MRTARSASDVVSSAANSFTALATAASSLPSLCAALSSSELSPVLGTADSGLRVVAWVCERGADGGRTGRHWRRRAQGRGACMAPGRW